MVVMRARLAVLAGLFSLCCSAGGALAQQPPAQGNPPARGDRRHRWSHRPYPSWWSTFSRCCRTRKRPRWCAQQIEAKRAEYAKEISHKEEALRQERDQLQRQQATLSADSLPPRAAISKQRSTNSTVTCRPSVRRWNDRMPMRCKRSRR